MGRRRRRAGPTALVGLLLAAGSAVAARPAAALLTGPGDLPAPQEGPAAARDRAREILGRPELRPPPRPLIERLLDEIGTLLGRILRGAGGGNLVLSWSAVAVVAGLLALVLWRAVRALQIDPRAGLPVDGRRRPPADWRAEAAAHEAAGRWRDSLRCTWRATVADLAARGLVEEVPGRTTGEYRAGVARSLPVAAEPFSRATRLFEDAWYAAVEVGPADAAQVRALGDQVLAEARR